MISAFLLLHVLLACTGHQEEPRTEILRTVLHATIRDGYPWSRPFPTAVSLKTTDSCDVRVCPASDAVPGDTLPLELQRFISDSLQSEVVSPLKTACHVDRGRSLLFLAEPHVTSDTAYVGVIWSSCVRHPFMAHDAANARAIIELLRVDRKWKINRLALQTIS